MPQQFTGNTFKEVYRDDWKDSDGYHRVLFNSGRPLQARELTTLQTILQEQITKFASNIFQDGAAVSTPSAGAMTASVDYVIVTDLNNNTVEDLIGVVFQGPVISGVTSGVQFVVTHVLPANGGEEPVLYGRYISSNQETENGAVQTTNDSLKFSDGQTLTDIRAIPGITPNVGSLTVRTRPSSSQLQSVGKGMRFAVQGSDFFTQGHFVYAESQSIIIGKYDDTPDLVTVGYQVVQDIVTVADTEDLYDNQGARPNLSSPGADRYRIKLVLTTQEAAADENFVTFAVVRNGVIINQKGADEGFNQVEKRMATRHKETSGNFVASDFLIRYEESGDSTKLELEVPDKVNGVNPIAYVDGFRLIHEYPYSTSVDKPLSFTRDSDAVSGVDYRNYITVTDTAGFSDYTGTEVARNQKHELYDSATGGNLIGTCRIKAFKYNGTTGNDFARVYLFDVRMNDGENFREVKSIANSTSSTNRLVPYLEDGQLFAQEPNNNDSLFTIPGGRVKAVRNVNFAVQRSEVVTATGTTVQITCDLGESFIDEGQWVIHKIGPSGDTELTAPGNITSSGQTSDITVAQSGADYLISYYVQLTDAPEKSKTYREEQVTFTRVPGTDTFTPATTMYDGIKLLWARDSDSDGSNLLNSLEFDGGQRDNYYGPIEMRGDEVPASVSTIKANISYFEHGTTGNYFSVESYDLTDPAFGYADIPDYQIRNSGAIVSLHDVFDFRTKLDPSQDNMPAGDHFDLPRDGDDIRYEVDFYNCRVDKVELTYDENTFARIINYKKGDEALEPVEKDTSENSMVLYTVMLNGNTKNTEDMEIKKHTYPRYRMSEVNELEQRVARLEETVSLTFLESEAINHTEFDSDGNVRIRSGFFADDFTGAYKFAASQFTPDFIDDERFITSSWDEETNVIYTKQSMYETQLAFDGDNLPAIQNRTGLTKTNVVVKGDTLMLEYVDVLDDTMKQELISWRSDTGYEERGYYNVNPFNVFTGEGHLNIRPSRDSWVDTRRLPDNIINGGTVRRISNPDFRPRTFNVRRNVRFFATLPWKGGWRTGWWLRRSFERVRTPVRTRVIGDEQVMTDLGTTRVGLSLIPFCRQKRIIGAAEGLRPLTRYWLYFDGVDVSQWTLSVPDETGYQNLIDSGVQNKNYSDVSVTVKKHPFGPGAGNTLTTDVNGKLWFDFWLPNNAPVPTGKNFDSITEWQNYIDQQRRLARVYGSHKNKNVFNDLGWKFRSGSRQMKLLDVSDNAEDNALSRARTTFTSSGQLNVSQRNILSTRVITLEQFQNEPESDPAGWADPLAQTFMVDGSIGVPGVFVTKVDTFLRSAPKTSTHEGGTDPAVPLQLQIRAVENGVPVSGAISEQHRVYKTADEVYSVVQNITNLESLSDVLANPVTFTFKEPIFLRSGVEYALVLLAECDQYEAFVATTYDLLLGETNKRVSKQPTMGSLFLSQNGSTWTPKQNQDLAYRIYTAKFKDEGSANLHNSPLTKHAHNFSTSLRADSDRFFVTHPGHGLGVGDPVELTGLKPTTDYGGGVTGSNIMDSSNVVDSADISGYWVRQAGGSTFPATTGVFGADSVETARGFNIDGLTMALNTIAVPQTEISYTGSFVTGFSHSQVSLTDTQDPRFDVINQPLQNRKYTTFTKPRYIASETVENDANKGGGVPSIVVGTTLRTDQVSAFGGDDALTAANNGYVSDISPLLDMQSMSMHFENNLVDNQPLDSDNTAGRIGTNAPSGYVPETHPTNGTSPSKHITKVITLDQAANSVRVFLELNRPPEAGVDLYFRSTATTDEDIYAKEWTYIEGDNLPRANPENIPQQLEPEFSEYRYLIGGKAGTELPDFSAFQVKVVFRATNTTQAPCLKSIRAIAVV